MMEPLVLYDKVDNIAILTLNRPSALNAVNLAMRDELWGLLLAVRDDPDVHVAVLRGAGERGFCAGADIKEFGTAPSIIAARRARQERDLWGLMIELETPLIAQIHGWALGAGCEISLLCDIRIASDDAQIGIPIARTLGNCLSIGNLSRLVDLVGPAHAKEALFSSKLWSAERAHAVGFLTEVVPAGALDERVAALAHLLATQAPLTLRATKEGIRRILASRRTSYADLAARVGIINLHGQKQSSFSISRGLSKKPSSTAKSGLARIERSCFFMCGNALGAP